jgi:predicted MarR family transcription regulator
MQAPMQAKSKGVDKRVAGRGTGRTGSGRDATPARGVGAANTHAPSKAIPARAQDELNTTWHLSRDELEATITELEFSLMRISAAFDRWIAECLEMVAKAPLGSAGAPILHVIALKNRPKTPSEIARLLNRDDVPNVLYSIRKLEAAKLVERVDGGRRKSVVYRVTRRGRSVVIAYAELRAKVLMPRIPRLEGWDERLAGAKDFLDLMRGVYDQAALVVATHRDWRPD